MILTIASMNTWTDLSPAKERKYSNHKGQSPDEANDVGDASRCNNRVVTEGVVYCCRESHKCQRVNSKVERLIPRGLNETEVLG